MKVYGFDLPKTHHGQYFHPHVVTNDLSWTRLPHWNAVVAASGVEADVSGYLPHESIAWGEWIGSDWKTACL